MPNHTKSTGFKSLPSAMARFHLRDFERHSSSDYYDHSYGKRSSQPIDLELLRSAQKNDLKTMEELLAQGADPGGDGYINVPVIYSLCVDEHYHAAIFLIKRVPRCVHALTTNHLSIFNAIVSRKDDLGDHQKKLRDELLELALQQGSLYQKTIPGEQASNSSILHICYDVSLLKIFLKFKPDPFFKNIYGETPREKHLKRMSESLMSEQTKYQFGYGSKENFEEFIKILAEYESHYKMMTKISNAASISTAFECIREGFKQSEQAKADKDVLKIIGEYMEADFINGYAEFGPCNTADAVLAWSSENPKVIEDIIQKLKKEQTEQSKRDKIKF